MDEARIPQGGLDAYVSALPVRMSLKWRGALFVNAPTPSGCDRWLLRMTSDIHFDSPKQAVDWMAEQVPEARKPEIPATYDVPLDPPPAGSLVTIITPRVKDGADGVEVMSGRSRLAMALTREQAEQLVERGLLEPESSSGDDPELSARYDHYVMTDIAV